MNVVGCMIFYDEAPEMLYASVSSLAGVADALVAVDGAFAAFPRENSPPWSPPEQLAAISEGCGGRLQLLAYQPVRAGEWLGERGNEVEKRNVSVHLAGQNLAADWVFNTDADMMLESALGVREQLEETKHDVAVTTIAGTATRHVYRYSPGLRHVHAHWLVINERGILSAPTSTGVRRSLPYGEMLPALDLCESFVFQHPVRTGPRRERQVAWYAVRDREGIEAMPD